VNGIILYKSKYGATKKYAEWLRDATGFDIVETKKADIAELSKYDTIVFGGGIYASGIAGLSFLKKHTDSLKDKRLAVFCVGASPFDKNAFDAIYAHNFKDNLSGVKCFYCRGAWDMDAMSLPDRTLCQLLQKSMAKKDPATFEPWQVALMSAVGQTCDWTDKVYLHPLLEFIKK
jgi:menaquinone-dependent protoporphyrinogen IX oxidase